jgi:hypothetical protein
LKIRQKGRIGVSVLINLANFRNILWQQGNRTGKGAKKLKMLWSLLRLAGISVTGNREYFDIIVSNFSAF